MVYGGDLGLRSRVIQKKEMAEKYYLYRSTRRSVRVLGGPLHAGGISYAQGQFGVLWSGKYR